MCKAWAHGALEAAVLGWSCSACNVAAVVHCKEAEQVVADWSLPFAYTKDGTQIAKGDAQLNQSN